MKIKGFSKRPTIFIFYILFIMKIKYLTGYYLSNYVSYKFLADYLEKFLNLSMMF